METRELQLVTFEQAKRLRELGFDYGAYHWYRTTSQLHQSVLKNHNSDINFCYSAPSIALALKWFRDEKKMYIDGGFYVPDKKYRFFYGEQKNILTEKRTDVFDTYEQAKSALLDDLLTILESLQV